MVSMMSPYQGVDPRIEEGAYQGGGHTESQIHEGALLIQSHHRGCITQVNHVDKRFTTRTSTHTTPTHSRARRQSDLSRQLAYMGSSLRLSGKMS